MTSNYVVITPARNEERNLEHTIRSMAAQIVLPARWVIVDDGSTDATASIIATATRQYPWISGVSRPDRGFRKQGGGVIDTFYDGFNQLPSSSWDFLVKFDADLSFAPDFFERCFDKFRLDSKLGIGGGMICHTIDGNPVSETPDDPPFHVRGATKIYRRECWDQIGGLLRAPGWDTIDELKANMLGWTTRTFPDIPLKHHRSTGAADGSWKNWEKNGVANYITGYHPVFMLLKCLKRSTRPPYFIGALGLWWGFCRGYLQRVARVNDPALIQYVRRQQLNRLTMKPSLW